MSWETWYVMKWTFWWADSSHGVCVTFLLWSHGMLLVPAIFFYPHYGVELYQVFQHKREFSGCVSEKTRLGLLYHGFTTSPTVTPRCQHCPASFFRFLRYMSSPQENSFSWEGYGGDSPSLPLHEKLISPIGLRPSTVQMLFQGMLFLILLTSCLFSVWKMHLVTE